MTSRHSALQWLVQQAETKFLPFAAAVLLPHALAFLAAHFIMSRRSGQAVEVLHEKKEAPKSLSYIIERAGPMWLIHMLGIFSFATGAPSVVRSLVTVLVQLVDGHVEIQYGCGWQCSAERLLVARKFYSPDSW